MEALRLHLLNILSYLISLTISVSQHIFTLIPRIRIFVPIIETTLSLYFKYLCNLEECTIELDNVTKIHFWVPSHHKFNRPNLIMIHGYGGNSKWQFVNQIGSLSKSFNLYIPDLLFFGKSYTNCANRSENFQAECVRDGLKKLGVERCSVYGISYGGYVGYHMAENYKEVVEKLVIVSSGVGCSEEEKVEQLKTYGGEIIDLLLPEKPDGLRLLTELTIHKYNPFRWAPDFILQEFIEVMCDANRNAKQELLEHLLASKSDCDAPALTQDTLLIWGDKDKVFPLSFAYKLQRKLGPHVKLEVIPDTGHAANVESPYSLNALITEFILPPKK